jgi:predicted nuclease of restriction endonuclease-like (RecB) superfamily
MATGNIQYGNLLAEVKGKIRDAQVKTVMAANSQMLLLYWQLGNLIIQNQQQKGWGAKIIDRLAKDLHKEFPAVKGFSTRNLLYMKQFAESCGIGIITRFVEIENELKKDITISQPLVAKLLNVENDEFSISQQPVAKLKKAPEKGLSKRKAPAAKLKEELFLQSILARISWSHHIVLQNKVKHFGQRFWYMLNTIEHGNSRNILSMQIESSLFERQVKAKKINNFQHTLPASQTDFANYLLKDPYIFDFVQAKESADERNIEDQLANHIKNFLLELGQGFAFIGRQVRFEIGQKDYAVDLLFYHTRLHAYVVVELKTRPFEPGDAGKLNFYINVVNDKLKGSQDNDTIGILLCKGKNEVLAEYALRGYSRPMGVSDYQFAKAVPDELKSQLPGIDELEHELEKEKMD